MIDKTLWGDGPWQNEPDELRFEYKGYTCELRRNIFVTGAWCGYVFMKSTCKASTDDKYKASQLIKVHGEITYAYLGIDDSTGEEICILGFDLGHLNDLMPLKQTNTGMINLLNSLTEAKGTYAFKKIYRTMKYAKKQCESMVDQIIELEKSHDPITRTQEENL